MSKLNLKKIIGNMKEAIKATPSKPTHNHSQCRERNMMQEAMDMGSHQANDIFKDTPK